MTNDENNTNSPDPRITDALSQLGRDESRAPSELTRKRHLSAMKRESAPRSIRSLVAVAAAVVLVAAAGVVVKIGTNGSTNNSVDLASAPAEPLALKKVDFVTAVPFNRTEEYVMLSVTAKRADDVASELLATLGSEAPVIGSTSKSTTFVVPASVARTLNDTSGLTVVTDTPMKSVAEQTPVPSWGLDRLDALTNPLDDSYKYFSEGTGSTVYVIDTGIYSGHSDFGSRVVSGYSAVADGRGSEDCNGHGTHVAGTIAGSTYGVAKSSRLVAVRVLDCTGSGYSSSVVAGINWVIASHPGGPGVINLSLGGGANSAVDAAVADATAAGIVVVVAAGNDSADACNYSPARAPSAVTIGATDRTDARASFSNSGSCVDLYAPGSGITSDGISSSTATATMSGTSMASPHIAGLAARLMQAQPGITASGIRDRLIANTPAGSVVIANFVEADPGPVVTTTTPVVEPTTTLVDAPTTTLPVDSTPTTTTVIAPTTTAPRTSTTAPRTSTTAPRSSTTLPRTSTTAPRRGETEKKPEDNKKPEEEKKPAPEKTVMQPKEFSIRYQDRLGVETLVATWSDDGKAEKYQIKCEKLKDKKGSDDETRIVIERSAVTLVADGKSETVLAISPKDALKCSLVGMIGTTKSKESNQAILPAQPRRPVVTTTTTSTTSTTTSTTTTTTLPPTTSSSSTVVTQKAKPPVAKKRTDSTDRTGSTESNEKD